MADNKFAKYLESDTAKEIVEHSKKQVKRSSVKKTQAKSIKVSQETYDLLAAINEKTGMPKAQAFSRAVKSFYQEIFNDEQ